MNRETTQSFLDAFQAGDVEKAEALLPMLESHSGFKAHPLLCEFTNRNSGHCYKRRHIQIADLLIPAEVRSFRDAVVEDRIDDVRLQLQKQPNLVSAEFTAGRGIAQAIHHWRSVPVGELLLSAGADINALTTVHSGETPLAMQVRFGSIEAVRFLLEKGADPNLRPKMHMPSKTMRALIGLLLEYGWDIHRGSQLLHDANHGHGSRIGIWLDHGVDPNLRNEAGRSALHLLAARGTGREAIRALVDAGADLKLKDNNGRTPLDVARSAKRLTAAGELIELGAMESP